MNRLRELLFPLIAVVAAFIVGGILILIIGDNPLTTYALLFGSAFDTDPQFPWAAEILQSADHQMFRAELLHEKANEYLERSPRPG